MSSTQEKTQETQTIQIRVIPNPKKKPKHRIITIMTNREKPKRQPRTPKKVFTNVKPAAPPVGTSVETSEEDEKFERLFKRRRAYHLGKLKQKGAIVVTVDPSKTLPMLLKGPLVVKMNPNKTQPVTNQVQSMPITTTNPNMVKKCEVIKIEDNDDLFESCTEWTKWIKQEQPENGQGKK